MKADILSIGTELLMGEITDTNATFIASRLPALGIQVRGVAHVGDVMEDLAEAFQRALDRSDLVMTTGGLGPTQDDLTREAIANVMGEEITIDPELVEWLRGYFHSRGIDMPKSNIKQASRITSCQIIPNRRGTAPGWWVEKKGKYIVAMPGVPGELYDMWDKEVQPRLQKISTGQVLLTRSIKTMGLTEAAVGEHVPEHFNKDNPFLGIYAKPDGIHLRIIARASTQAEARALILPVEKAIRDRLDRYIWGFDSETSQSVACSLLKEHNLSLATMESCTGGLLANTLTLCNESAGVYKGGFITPTTESLINSGIPSSLIEAKGAVSPEVAEAMANVARYRFQAHVGVGITGVAEPDERQGRDQGVVHTAIAFNARMALFRTHLPPRRALIRERAVSGALVELVRLLKVI